MGDNSNSDEPRWPPHRIAAALGLASLILAAFAVSDNEYAHPMPGWAWIEILAIGLAGMGLTAVVSWVRPKNDAQQRQVGRQFIAGSALSLAAGPMIVQAQVDASGVPPQTGYMPSALWIVAIVSGLYLLSFSYERALARRFPAEAERAVRAKAKAWMPQSSEVLVDGWSKEELAAILEEFSALYGLGQSMIVIDGAGPYRLSFSEPLSIDEFMFLVNYLPYPIGKDLEDRHIAVVGRSRVTPAMKFGLAVELDSEVHFHVPDDDSSYDCVMAQTAAGSFIIDFGASKPRKNPERRESAAQIALATTQI